MSAAIFDFNEIPFDWLQPGTFLEVRPNYRNAGLFPWPVRNLIIGQKLATGTLVPGNLVEIVDPDEAVALFGVGSIGAEQVAAFRKANRTQPLFVQALADAGASTKATGTFTFVGGLTNAVTLRFKGAGKRLRILAKTGDTVTQLATKLAAAINAESSATVTAGSAAGVVTVTSRHGGEVGNDIDIRVDEVAQAIPDGLTINVVKMSGGTGNPDITPALDVIATTWYTDITHPWNDLSNMDIFEEFLRERYVALAKLDAHGYVAKRGTYGQLGTFGELTNSAFLSGMGLNNSPTSSWILSAAVCGLSAFHLTNDPARQLKTLVVPGVEAPDPLDQFNDTERDLLLRKGVSTFDHVGDDVTISRLITTYRISNSNVPDRAWLDIMTAKTMSRIRYDWSVYMALQFPRAKLINDDSYDALTEQGNQTDEDGVDLGPSITAPKVVKGSWAARCALYRDRVWIQDVERTIRESNFAISDADDNTLISNQQVKIVGNLMVLAGALEFQV